MTETQANERSHLRCKIIIEVLGKPKEHIEKTIRDYVDKIKDDSDLILMDATFSDAEEKGELWAVFVEMDLVIKGLQKLVAFCFDYMPSSVEISKPSEFTLRREFVESFTNDLQARLHQVDMIIKKLDNENGFLKKNMQKAVANVILISLANRPSTKEQLSKVSGVQEKELQIFLDQLLKENKIKEENDIFSIVPKNAQTEN